MRSLALLQSRSLAISKEYHPKLLSRDSYSSLESEKSGNSGGGLSSLLSGMGGGDKSGGPMSILSGINPMGGGGKDGGPMSLLKGINPMGGGGGLTSMLSGVMPM